MRKIGMFEKVTAEDTGETFIPTSGRGGYTNVVVSPSSAADIAPTPTGSPQPDPSTKFPTNAGTARGIKHDRMMHEFRMEYPTPYWP